MKQAIDIDLLRKVYRYEPETGLFTHAIRRLGVVQGAVSGCDNGRGYLRVTFNGKSYYAHRLAWAYVYGELPTDQIDHINGDKKDNRIVNLRLATNAENSWNKAKAKKNSRSQVLGVTWHKKAQKWQAFFKKEYLGLFESIERAKAAYDERKNQANPFIGGNHACI